MSAPELIHPVPLAEFAPWLSSMIVTFLGDPAESASETPFRAATFDPQRAWGIRADGRWVATLRTVPHRLSIPGPPGRASTGEIDVDGLTNVTVAATHRRQGLLRAMITESLAAARERGDAASILIAAEWPIYGRYGYAPASDVAHYTVHTRQPGAHLNRPADGRVRQVDAAEFIRLASPVFDAVRRTSAGQIDRGPDWWARIVRAAEPSAKRPAPIHIVHEGAAGVDGYLSWTPVGDWDLIGNLGKLKVSDLMAVTDGAYRGLWQYLLGMDVVDQVLMRDRPVDEPLPYLLADGRAIRQAHRIDLMWIRLLDVAAALTTRRYGVADSLVLDVVDDDGAGFAAGTYLLDGGTDGAQCQRTSREPDLRLSQRALAGTYLGGTSLRRQLVAGEIEELTSGAISRLDAMFATPRAPWCATGF